MFSKHYIPSTHLAAGESKAPLKVYAGVGVEIHAFFTLALDGDGQPYTTTAVHRSEVHPVLTGSWVGCRAGSGWFEEKNLLSLPGTETQFLCHPASCLVCTVSVIPVLILLYKKDDTVK
jgi:hypothetical protein